MKELGRTSNLRYVSLKQTCRGFPHKKNIYSIFPIVYGLKIEDIRKEFDPEEILGRVKGNYSWEFIKKIDAEKVWSWIVLKYG